MSIDSNLVIECSDINLIVKEERSRENWELKKYILHFYVLNVGISLIMLHSFCFRNFRNKIRKNMQTVSSFLDIK